MTTATKADILGFLDWLQGRNMPTDDTIGWLVRCEEWVGEHLEEDENSFEWNIRFPLGDKQ